MVKTNSEARYSVIESETVNDLPKDIYMSDISADKTCMAVIYKTTARDDEKVEDGEERYMLTLYNLYIDQKSQKLTRNTDFKEVDVSYITTSNNPVYIFLSVFGRNGYVALSFVEMGDTGQLTSPSDGFENCIIYGEEKTIKKIPFQGRAVFLEDRFVLVGLDALVVYEYTENNDFKKKYTLDTQALSMGYEATIHQTEIIKDIPWAKYIGLPTPIAGHDIITMSRHIKSNVLVTRYDSKEGNIVRIWSIFDGTLLTSYSSQYVEHVMAISDNHRNIATYDEKEKVAKIYCTKTNVALHTIPINTQSNADNSTFTLSYMRFFGDGRYIIISGFMTDATYHSDHRVYAFEVWYIPIQKLLFADKQEVYWQPNIIPFSMEFKNRCSILSFVPYRAKIYEQRLRAVEYGRQHSLPEMKAIFTSRENQKAKIETKSLFKQNWSKSNEDAVKSWKVKDANGEEIAYKVKFLNSTLGDLEQRSELNDSLDIYENLFCCSISNGTDHFILRFGYYTAQLWRLKEVPSPLDETKKKKLGFQLEEGEDQPYFYKSMEDSELVYIRTYKANDYGLGFTFREDWSVQMNKRTPDVIFTDDLGHIFVKIEGKFEYSKNKKDQPSDQNSREFLEFFQKKWPLNKMKCAKNSQEITNHVVDVDEIFLPLHNLGTSTSNRSSIIDSTANSTRSDFHEIESACCALHHFNNKEEKNTYKSELSKAKLSMLNDKVYKIIFRLFGLKKNVNFFTTVSGSKTLAMLASFSLGQDLLKYIITHPRIPINIFNYTKDKNAQESVLIVLIEERKFDLFNAFFHRIVIDSFQVGPENLSSVTESLLCLQREKIPELLLHCFKKLSYIPVTLDKHPIFGSDYTTNVTAMSLQQGSTPSLRTLDSFSALEQIYKYNDTARDRFLFSYAKWKRTRFVRLINAAPATLYWYIFGESKTTTMLAKVCVVPLSRFNDYKVQPEENIYDGDVKLKDTLLEESLIQIIDSLSNNNNGKLERKKFENVEYRTVSSFTRAVSNSKENQVFKQPDTIMEVITQYKWKTFLRSRFYLILFIHAIYYISYTTAISFPEELYDYVPGSKVTHRGHLISIALMFASGSLLFLQETLQFFKEKGVYFTSFFNWVDIVAFVLPVLNLCLLLNDSELLLDVGSITILVLWTHAILRLRAFSYFGQILEIIIQIFLKIMPFICIMFLVIFAFTHALIYRLRNMSDQFFQEKYQGGPTDTEGNPLDSSTLITMYDTSSQNEFSNPFKAFSVVWFFIYGMFDPVNSGDAGDDTMTKILIILFSFITILIFSNMVIALMSSTVDEVIGQGNVARLSHFSAVIGEIELFWCSRREKHDKVNNPNYIYYVANVLIIEKHWEKLQEDNMRLLEKLG